MKKKLLFYLTEDDLRIENGSPVARPPHISRSRWMAFWQHTSVTGFKFYDVGRFFLGEPELTDKEVLERWHQRKPS